MADYPLLYNGQSNFVDLASVPVGMVERIDVAPGNQSSIYGSSAIAGVVNIILKKRMDGMQMNYRMGTYDGGGGNNQRFQLTGGNAIGGANIVWGCSSTIRTRSTVFNGAISIRPTTTRIRPCAMAHRWRCTASPAPGQLYRPGRRQLRCAGRAVQPLGHARQPLQARQLLRQPQRSATQAFSTRSAVRAVTPT